MSESNIQASPGSIFICYRRQDSADVTGRIYDRLVDHFGSERVFMDVEAIRLGYDFRSEIDQTIKVCSIVIVVIVLTGNIVIDPRSVCPLRLRTFLSRTLYRSAILL